MIAFNNHLPSFTIAQDIMLGQVRIDTRAQPDLGEYGRGFARDRQGNICFADDSTGTLLACVTFDVIIESWLVHECQVWEKKFEEHKVAPDWDPILTPHMLDLVMGDRDYEQYYNDLLRSDESFNSPAKNTRSRAAPHGGGSPPTVRGPWRPRNIDMDGAFFYHG